VAEQELKACGSCGLPTTETDSYRSGPNGEREHFLDAASGCDVRQYQAKISSLTARAARAEARVVEIEAERAETEARLSAAEAERDNALNSLDKVMQDATEAEAEVERLRAENVALREDVAGTRRDPPCTLTGLELLQGEELRQLKIRDADLVAEVERLRKRNGELVALLGVTSKHLAPDERAREQKRLDARSCRCLCCWRDVCEDDYPEGTGCKIMCNECFREWYDGDRPEAGTDAGNTAACIGGWIRKKHGLPPLTDEELEAAAARRQQGGTDAR